MSTNSGSKPRTESNKIGRSPGSDGGYLLFGQPDRLQAAPALDRFNAVIAELHKFEHIRYPENLIKEGGMLSIGFPSGARTVRLSGPKLPEHQVCVTDVDALVAEIFRLANVNADNMLHTHTEEKYQQSSAIAGIVPMIRASS